MSSFVEISKLNANSVDPDQMPRSAASDLRLHRLPMSLLWDARHILIKPRPSVVFTTDRSKAVPLLQFIFVCASMVSYEAFVLSLFAPHLSFFWCLRKDVLRDCDFRRDLHICLMFAFLHRNPLFKRHLRTLKERLCSSFFRLLE